MASSSVTSVKKRGPYKRYNSNSSVPVPKVLLWRGNNAVEAAILELGYSESDGDANESLSSSSQLDNEPPLKVMAFDHRQNLALCSGSVPVFSTNSRTFGFQNTCLDESDQIFNLSLDESDPNIHDTSLDKSDHNVFNLSPDKSNRNVHDTSLNESDHVFHSSLDRLDPNVHDTCLDESDHNIFNSSLEQIRS
uniref:Uncharacterized protein n=1 Tax=Amphimedon queenslandica TaxID=400682 RepID=A0A1X7T0S3_AMPQE